MKKIKLLIAYFCIFLMIIMYVFSTIISYDYSVSNLELTNEINELEGKIEESVIQIYEQNARETVVEKYPDLRINDNIYFLEEYEETE